MLHPCFSTRPEALRLPRSSSGVIARSLQPLSFLTEQGNREVSASELLSEKLRNLRDLEALSCKHDAEGTKYGDNTDGDDDGDERADDDSMGDADGDDGGNNYDECDQ